MRACVCDCVCVGCCIGVESVGADEVGRRWSALTGFQTFQMGPTTINSSKYKRNTYKNTYGIHVCRLNFVVTPFARLV